MFSKGMIIFSVITGVIGTVCAVIGLVDQVKNGDRRAAIQGCATGLTLGNYLKSMPNNDLEDKIIEATKKELKKWEK